MNPNTTSEGRILWGAIAFLALLTLAVYAPMFIVLKPRIVDTYIMDYHGNVLLRLPWPSDRNEFYYLPPSSPAPSSPVPRSTPAPINYRPYQPVAPSWTGVG